MLAENIKTHRDKWLAALALILVLAATAFQLHNQGRIWWCACGQPNLWDGDIWGSHNSQHLLDAYSFTHVLHGVLFCGLAVWLLPRIPLMWRLLLAVTVESLWELLENSQFIINRYREATISQGYAGDSIINSISDIFCCGFGFLLAMQLGFRKSAVLFVATEIILLLWVKDNLALNILMLIHPIEAIKQWQMVH